MKGFSTTCPALSAVLYYRFIPYAAECCALSSIKLQAGESEKCGEMWSFLSATKILAIFEDCDKVIYYSLLTEKEEKCVQTILLKKKKKKVEIMCQ